MSRSRASRLPDVSVEQMFLSGEDYSDGKSRYFTVRTTEKQKGTGAGQPRPTPSRWRQVAARGRATMSYPTVTGPTVVLSFDKPTSPGYIKELLGREFRRAGGRGCREHLRDQDAAARRGSRWSLQVDDARRLQEQRLRTPTSRSDRRCRAQGKPTQIAGVSRGLVPNRHSMRSPEPERLEVFDSQLAADTRNKAFYAILASWVVILMYLWFRFGNWTFGAAAVLCLLHDLCFTLGCIAVCHYLAGTLFGVALRLEDFKIDLASVAALS